jgi:hypothetical protein
MKPMSFLLWSWLRRARDRGERCLWQDHDTAEEPFSVENGRLQPKPGPDASGHREALPLQSQNQSNGSDHTTSLLLQHQESLQTRLNVRTRT